MKLFFSSGAGSFAPHIILNELEIPFTLESVDLPGKKYGKKNDESFQKANPGGRIPTLILDDGTRLQECVAILIYLADLKPELNLIARHGTMERYKQIETLSFIATELHKVTVSLFMNPNERMAAYFKSNLEKFHNEFDSNVPFSVTHAYLVTILGWLEYIPKIELNLEQFPKFKQIAEMVADRPSYKKALHTEEHQFD